MAKRKPPQESTDRFRDRIRELRRVRAGDIVPHPKNPRTHSAAQLAATTGMLVDVGKVRALYAFPADGLGPKGDFSRLMYADGHGRRAIDPNETWPVIVLDLTMAEATEQLFADDITGMAGYDPVLLDAALREVNTGCEDLANLLESIADDAGLLSESDDAVTLNELDTMPPPAMSWALIGIPTVRFGEIAERLESLAEVEDIILETTSNDG